MPPLFSHIGILFQDSSSVPLCNPANHRLPALHGEGDIKPVRKSL